MKLMIASDIHGSAYYCGKLLARYGAEKPGRLVLLGDLLYHGPRNDLPRGYQPKEVITMLNGLKDQILCVRGNCEAEVDQMVLEFPVLSDSMILYLGGRMVFATHGHVVNRQNPPCLHRGDVLLNGHTHVPVLEEADGILYLNPGSVSIPKEDSVPSYMVYEDGCFILRDLDGREIARHAL